MKYCVISVLLNCSIVAFAQDHHNEQKEQHGPHGGRLLTDGNVQLELAIYESGVPPEYRAWIAQNGDAVRFSNVRLTVELMRLGGQIDRIQFSPRGDYLVGDKVVTEPHSFDVQVTATVNGTQYEWQYPSHEGRVTIAPAIAEEAGIVTGIAGEQTLHQTVHLFGKTVTDPQQISHIRARYPGLIQQVHVALGDRVEAGAPLLRVEANSSLQSYTVTSPISGTVIQRHANPGEVTGDDALLTIADYHQLWLALNVFPNQADRIKAGQAVRVTAGDRRGQTEIRYLTPSEHGGPSILARALLDNSDERWTPDLMVNAQVTVGEYRVPLAVDNRALQRFRDWTVVFIQVGDTYEIRPLELGRDDGSFTEVLSGLNVGDRYVIENSYLIKADIEKSGAAHHH